mmetsp:Transcript_26909/g.69193  ORF Transcript_26909/g.69193 Transcript_26909/m.69193 type:complete len:100 (-) Transcript_26909:1301-1600(-)
MNKYTEYSNVQKAGVGRREVTRRLQVVNNCQSSHTSRIKEVRFSATTLLNSSYSFDFFEATADSYSSSTILYCFFKSASAAAADARVSCSFRSKPSICR